MLRFTKKADYGLMALKFLAEHPDHASLSAKDISDAYHIPPQLLAKILQRMAKSGLLHSHAGMNGGYTLSRKADEISVLEVIRIIDGPLFITSCAAGSRPCDLASTCTIREPLARVNDAIADVLLKVHISDLVEYAAAKDQQRATVQASIPVQTQAV